MERLGVGVGGDERASAARWTLEERAAHTGEEGCSGRERGESGRDKCGLGLRASEGVVRTIDGVGNESRQAQHRGGRDAAVART